MIIKSIFYTGLFTSFVLVMDRMQPVASKTLINDMHACRAVIQFVDRKVDERLPGYAQAHAAQIHESLSHLDIILQTQFIEPSLSNVSEGDAQEIMALQEQINTYKMSLLAEFDEEYPQKVIPKNMLSRLDDCREKAQLSPAQSLEMARMIGLLDRFIARS